MYTPDRGNVWINKRDSTITSNIFNIVFANEQTGVFHSPVGEIYSTTNGGKQWKTVVTSPFRVRQKCLQTLCTTNGTFWAVGENGLVLSWKPDITGATEKPVPIGILISPNPASESFMVHCPDAASVTVRDVFGRITSQQFDMTGTEAVISTADYASGVYFVEVTGRDNSRVVQKVVISR